jgi:transcriptional regulator with XRE-family HTH domain
MKNLHDLKKETGKKVKALRNEKGWSQEELANKAGKGITYICELEAGKENPTIETLWQIAHALGADVTVLIELR